MPKTTTIPIVDGSFARPNDPSSKDDNALSSNEKQEIVTEAKSHKQTDLSNQIDSNSEDALTKDELENPSFMPISNGEQQKVVDRAKAQKQLDLAPDSSVTNPEAAETDESFTLLDLDYHSKSSSAVPSDKEEKTITHTSFQKQANLIDHTTSHSEHTLTTEESEDTSFVCISAEECQAAVHGAEAQKQFNLATYRYGNHDPEKQIERDIDMVYQAITQPGTSQEDEFAGEVLRRVCILLCFGQLHYRNKSKQWLPWTEQSASTTLPIASALCHGSRVLIEFPAGFELLDWLLGPEQENYFRYMATHGIGKRSKPQPFSTIPTEKISDFEELKRSHLDASTDFLKWAANNCSATLHERAAATLKWVITALGEEEITSLKGRLVTALGEEEITSLKGLVTTLGASLNWLTTTLIGEEQASFPKILNNDFKHYGVNLALGGEGNKNSYSGNLIANNGEHGHLYLCHKKPMDDKPKGALLIGIEQSAPWHKDQYGGAHDLQASPKHYSATGGDLFSKVDIENYTGLKDIALEGYYDNLCLVLNESDIARIKKVDQVMSEKMESSFIRETENQTLFKLLGSFGYDPSPRLVSDAEISKKQTKKDIDLNIKDRNKKHFTYPIPDPRQEILMNGCHETLQLLKDYNETLWLLRQALQDEEHKEKDFSKLYKDLPSSELEEDDPYRVFFIPKRKNSDILQDCSLDSPDLSEHKSKQILNISRILTGRYERHSEDDLVAKLISLSASLIASFIKRHEKTQEDHSFSPTIHLVRKHYGGCSSQTVEEDSSAYYPLDLAELNGLTTPEFQYVCYNEMKKMGPFSPILQTVFHHKDLFDRLQCEEEWGVLFCQFSDTREIKARLQDEQFKSLAKDFMEAIISKMGYFAKGSTKHAILTKIKEALEDHTVSTDEVTYLFKNFLQLSFSHRHRLNGRFTRSGTAAVQLLKEKKYQGLAKEFLQLNTSSFDYLDVLRQVSGQPSPSDSTALLFPFFAKQKDKAYGKYLDLSEQPRTLKAEVKRELVDLHDIVIDTTGEVATLSPEEQARVRSPVQDLHTALDLYHRGDSTYHQRGEVPFREALLS